MFRCRICSGTPFATLFGFNDTSNNQLKHRLSDSDNDDSSSLVPNTDDVSNYDNDELNVPRNAEEVAFLIKAWDTYVHERAKALWKTPSKRFSILVEYIPDAIRLESYYTFSLIRREVLLDDLILWRYYTAFYLRSMIHVFITASIAKECSKRDDPVLGNDITCVKWQGKYEDGYPVIFVNKPDEESDSTTYVNHQESYEKIDKEYYKAFEMACGNKWCINLTHISLY